MIIKLLYFTSVSFASYILIATGTSNRHIQSIANKVTDNLKDNKIKILGVGKSVSLGVHRGVVNNITQTIQSIQQAVEKAEEVSGIKVTEVTVGIAGQHIRSLQHSDYITRPNSVIICSMTALVIITFCCMEFVAWATHKYVMHGFLWVLHKDHHKKDHKSWFERNDLFFFFYAFLSVSFVVLWGEGFWLGLPIGLFESLISFH